MTMRRSELSLAPEADALRMIGEIERLIQRAEDHWNRSNQVPDYDDEDHRVDTAIAGHSIRRAWLTLMALLDQFGHRSLLQEATALYVQVKKEPLAYEWGYDDMFLNWSYEAEGYLQIVRTMHEKRGDSGKVADDVVSMIRRALPGLVDPGLHGWKPTEERDVHDRLEHILGTVHSDLLHEPPFPGKVKHFRADTGLPRAEVVIDYKFISTALRAKEVLDEILADMGGYQSPQYKTILFVIYETSRFVMEEAWMHDVRKANPPVDVRAVVLPGEPFSGADVVARSLALAAAAKRHHSRPVPPRGRKPTLTPGAKPPRRKAKQNEGQT